MQTKVIQIPTARNLNKGIKAYLVQESSLISFPEKSILLTKEVHMEETHSFRYFIHEFEVKKIKKDTPGKKEVIISVTRNAIKEL